MDKRAGKKWPWIISLSVVGIIAACAVTIKFALKNPDEPSDYGMQNYHEYDKNVNKIIEAKIAFDRLYTLNYASEPLQEQGSVIRYRITDKEGKGIDSADVSVVLTRPDTSKFDIVLDKPSVSDGLYTFKAINLPKQGRWDIMAKVSIDGVQRYFNIKADTRNGYTSEF